MAPNETAKLDVLLEQVSEHRSDFKVLCTELGVGLGDDRPSGRIPRLEKCFDDHTKVLEKHDRRIRKLESFLLLVAGAVALLKIVAAGAESIHHIIEALK